MRKLIRITYLDGSICYLSGFDISGEPWTVVREMAHHFPEFAAPVAARNTLNSLRYHNAGVRVELEEVD